jgi:hypothetical protein
MSRLRDKLRVASPSKRNRQPEELLAPEADATHNATEQPSRLAVSALPSEVFWFAEAPRNASERHSPAYRDRCWQVFERNATRLLEAPRRQRAVLLAIYRDEAARRYGEQTAMAMARTMDLWVESKVSGVH